MTGVVDEDEGVLSVILPLDVDVFSQPLEQLCEYGEVSFRNHFNILFSAAHFEDALTNGNSVIVDLRDVLECIESLEGSQVIVVPVLYDNPLLVVRFDASSSPQKYAFFLLGLTCLSSCYI